MKPDILFKLHDLRAENNAARAQMKEDAPRFQALKDRHETGTAPRAVSSFNLFQTPPELARRMVELADIPEGGNVLEPSAGLGRIYSAIRTYSKAGGVLLIEESADCCRELYGMTADDPGATLKQADFLTVEPSAFFDRVIMNPPFERGRDIKHTRHALKFLKPGGVLIGLCYNGTKQNRELEPIADSWEVLPARTFAKEGTGADVVLFTVIKRS